jgi:glycosyltransferase involved in cell wall biosynthesis
MADAAITAAATGYNVYFVTVNPLKEFLSAGGRATMLSLLSSYGETISIISADVDYSFEFGSEAYRANIYRDLILRDVPLGTPIIVSDDMAAWHAAAAVADKYPMIGVLHGDQDYYYSRAIAFHRQLSLCVCVSGRIEKNLLEKCKEIDNEKVHIIPCGIILPEFVPETQPKELARLVFVGRLTDYEKRAYDLISICEQLKQQGFPFQLHIAGNDESSKVEFTEKLKASGADKQVIFRGWQSGAEVQHLLSSSDILLLTSNSEGMPLVMMEALAAGCGFVGTRVSGVEDYEHHTLAENCVRVYCIGDIRGAIAGIRVIAAIPEAARRVAARKLAETEFRMEVCLDKYAAALAATAGKIIEPKTFRLSFFNKLQSRLIATARYLKVRGK